MNAQSLGPSDKRVAAGAHGRSDQTPASVRPCCSMPLRLTQKQIARMTSPANTRRRSGSRCSESKSWRPRSMKSRRPTCPTRVHSVTYERERGPGCVDVYAEQQV